MSFHMHSLLLVTFIFISVIHSLIFFMMTFERTLIFPGNKLFMSPSILHYDPLHSDHWTMPGQIPNLSRAEPSFYQAIVFINQTFKASPGSRYKLTDARLDSTRLCTQTRTVGCLHRQNFYLDCVHFNFD